VVLPIVGVGTYLKKEVQNIIIKQVVQETTVNMDRIEERLNNLFDRIVQVADLLTINEDLQFLASYEYDNSLAIFNMHREHRVFDEFLTHYEEISGIRFYSLNATLLNVGSFVRMTAEIMAEDWFQEAVARDGRVSWVLKTDEFTGIDYFTLIRLIKDLDGNSLGVLNIYISSTQLKTIFQDEPYEVIMSLNHETIIFHEGELRIGETVPFIHKIKMEEAVDYLMTDYYADRKVKINLRQFNPHRVLDSDVQIATIIPIEYVTREVNRVMQNVFLVVSVCLMASLVLILWFIKTFNDRISLLKHGMDQVASGNFTIKPSISGNDEIKAIYHKLYETMMSIQRLMREIYMEKVQSETWKVRQKESEFKWLASQINPHFLYNTLEMIRVKAIKNQGQDIAQIVKLLSKLLRRSLESQDQLIPLKKEIEFIEMYLQIQKLRFKDKIDYFVEMEAGCETYEMIPLLIQPIVENAFIHGIELKEERGEILISIYKIRDSLVIEVKDNGMGMETDRLDELHRTINQSNGNDSNSIGLKNVQQRIKLAYGSAHGIRIESQKQKGTTVFIYLPSVLGGKTDAKSTNC